VENVRREAQQRKGMVAEADAAYQLNMFGDFNHIEFEDLVDFYQHEQNWTNRMVLGDSLLVMNSLAEKEGLRGKVQMIYLDPPYGIKFGSNWQSRLRKRDVKDGTEADLTREPEQVKAFRDTWELGIHSYLSYLRDRFTVARELLTDSGSIFVQIGDENVHLVRCVLDEIFGSENFINLITVIKRSPQPDDFLSSVSDYILWYGKSREFTKFKLLFKEKTQNERNKNFTTSDLTSSHYYESNEFEFKGKKYKPEKRYWSTSSTGLRRLGIAARIKVSGNTLRYKRFDEDFPVMLYGNIWTDVGFSSFGDEKIYVVQSAVKLIQRCLLMSTDPGDLVLDPTCGSGTMAYVAEQWGRRWITIDTSRVSIALARMRLMTAKYPYYLLADSAEGKVKETEITLTPPSLMNGRGGKEGGDIRMGFVYQRVPHVTLKSIANNEEIDAIYEKWQQVMEPLRKEINEELGTNYEEWQMPRPPEEIASPEGRADNDVVGDCFDAKNASRNDPLGRWWEMRRKRQAEIDDSIAKRADVELLYDKPYEDNKRIRVCGPFTVESLSPHRVLATDTERPESEKLGEKMDSNGKFEQSIIENLRTSGVQNTRKAERLVFTRLENFAGAYLQAKGEYEESGKMKTVAVCIGPEHGTVGSDLIREAAKEAMLGVGFDLLVVLGFAFDPHISEDVKQYGKLKVLPGRINPDLMMGDLLKKTKNANLFTVFGEPDIEVKKEGEEIRIVLKGVDIFDPTTGEIRSSSTDDIACWFVDSDYNGESFFARQAYFCGMGDPYDKLKRALRSEVDEAAWNMLYKTESFSFPKPKEGKVAVKVINDYGDEVMKVFSV
jgi:adenine-specific DNA-methyltransferase